MNCPKCNNENPSDAQECEKCGIFFEKYNQKRDAEFAKLLGSLGAEPFKPIKIKIEALIKAYPDLGIRGLKFLTSLEKATEAINQEKFDEALGLLEDLKTKYPAYSEGADKHIKLIQRKNKRASSVNRKFISTVKSKVLQTFSLLKLKFLLHQKLNIKKIIPILLGIAIIGLPSSYLYSKKVEKESYLENLYFLSTLMPLSSIKCLEICEMYEKSWSDAIENREDFNFAILLTSAGIESLGLSDTIKKHKNDITKMVKFLNQPPDYYPDARRIAVDLYGVYTQLYALADTPKGSLMSYRETYRSLNNELISLSNKLKISLPENEKIQNRSMVLIDQYVTQDLEAHEAGLERTKQTTEAMKKMTEDIKRGIK